MMTIYIDADCKCYTSPCENLTAVETDAFEGKCRRYIEGYRFVPEGQTWVRADGTAFHGEMIAPWKPWKELDAYQREYEREQAAKLTEENAALIADMAQMVEDVYQSDLEMMGI